nr:unnamed protein product [Callosobruchus chinensis]
MKSLRNDKTFNSFLIDAKLLLKVLGQKQSYSMTSHVSAQGECPSNVMSVFHDEIEIEDFEYDEEEGIYHYPCPCGDRFEISKDSFTEKQSEIQSLSDNLKKLELAH